MNGASAKKLIFTVLAAGLALATAFFGFYAVLLVHAVVTFDGEGSLGHVGMYIAAALFPFLAVVCAALTFLAWRQARKDPGGPVPGDEGG